MMWALETPASWRLQGATRVVAAEVVVAVEVEVVASVATEVMMETMMIYKE